MNPQLQFDFEADKTNNRLIIRREFAAGRQLVWDAYTKSEWLDLWFAPKPMSTKTSHMDFSEGGYWLYAMIEPNGTEYWGRTDYTEVSPIDYYKALDAFSDSTGTINSELPRAVWDVTFSDLGHNTLVQTVVQYNSLQDLEVVLEMGMKEGLMSTLERLDELILELSK